MKCERCGYEGVVPCRIDFTKGSESLGLTWCSSCHLMSLPPDLVQTAAIGRAVLAEIAGLGRFSKVRGHYQEDDHSIVTVNIIIEPTRTDVRAKAAKDKYQPYDKLRNELAQLSEEAAARLEKRSEKK